MSSLMDEINAYYEARKPYTEMLRNLPASGTSEGDPLQDQNSTKATDNVQQEWFADLQTPNAEIKALLEKLEASRIADPKPEKGKGKGKPAAKQ